MLKLQLVRLAVILAAFFCRGNLPLQWLAHYCAGSGKVKKIPSHLISQVEDSLNLAIERGMYNNNEVFVHHSTLYEGTGFQNRPTLFYLVGGFTAKYLPSKKTVILKDVYDWHPSSSGEYFVSGFKFSPKLHRVLNLFLGEKYYPLSGFPMGNPGFSNRLWHDLEKVGARPFTTVGKASMVLDFPEEGWTKINWKRQSQTRDSISCLGNKFPKSTGKPCWTVGNIVS